MELTGLSFRSMMQPSREAAVDTSSDAGSSERSIAAEAVAHWHRHMRGEAGVLDMILADDVVFYSPVVFTPQRGKAITEKYLNAALVTFAGLADDGSARFRYTKEVIAGDMAVLEFETTMDGKYVNGVDIIRVDGEGRIVEFRVMVRPLQALNAVHALMGRELASDRSGE